MPIAYQQFLKICFQMRMKMCLSHQIKRQLVAFHYLNLRLLMMEWAKVSILRKAEVNSLPPLFALRMMVKGSTLFSLLAHTREGINQSLFLALTIAMKVSFRTSLLCWVFFLSQKCSRLALTTEKV